MLSLCWVVTALVCAVSRLLVQPVFPVSGHGIAPCLHLCVGRGEPLPVILGNVA